MKVHVLLVCAAANGLLASAQTVVTSIDPGELPGQRPYEMVWANRTEPAPPTLRFDKLDGWTVRVEGSSEAQLQVTRAQNVWDRPVARLRYRGNGKQDSKPTIVISLPTPVAVPDEADSVDLWVYGNRWDWENPPGTPPVRLRLRLRDAESTERVLDVDRVRWQEWWLVHQRLPAAWKRPLQLEGIDVAGGWQSEWREIFLDSVRAYQERREALSFAPRPQRNLTLFEGQSAGVNTGRGRLPFPTREETILPMQLTERFGTRALADAGRQFSFEYTGADARVTYQFDAEKGLPGLRVVAQGGEESAQPAVRWLLLDGARVQTGSAEAPVLKSAALSDDVVTAEYADGTILRLRLWQKSLVLDVINRTGQARELSFGQVSGVTNPRTAWIPYLNYGGGPHPCVLVSDADTNACFASLWLDWYRSNGAEPYAAESTSTNAARINGGIRYHTRTDGQRNPMFERMFITVSPVFEETLPTIPNPVGLHASEAAGRLWQESWGPDDFEKQMKRSRMLRAYGMDQLIQCNHEITWRDGGESFTLRLRAAPKKGGDDALQRYVAHQRGLGWMAGLYSNYTDFAPVNEFWTPDGVQRLSDGGWRSAWPRCYAEKPLKAVEFDALLAPQIKAKFNPNSAYTDVHTAVSPWGYNDYDARVPGAGTMAQTFYAYGELLRNDSRVYGGPIFSEGTYHWLYAGLADGNYALAYDGRPLAQMPLLPVFDLYQIHSRECDIGMGWTANFCDRIPDWRKPENLDRAIDRFLLNTLAYGHIGWLVEEEHGIARTCRSYYMLQQVQSRYGLKVPTRIAYWNGQELVGVSEAVVQDLPSKRRQLFVEYPGGLRLWLNDHPTENWTVADFPATGGQGRGRGRAREAITLPPAGWAVATGDRELISYSALKEGNRVDYLRSRAYTYLDGRGHAFSAPEAVSDGSLAIRAMNENRLEIIRASGTGAFTIRRPYGVQGEATGCEAYNTDGQTLSVPTLEDKAGETKITPVDGAMRYVLTFGKQGA